MHADDYHAFSERLAAKLQADERVLGLVLLGSTADQSRSPDQWSDHDFFVITRDGQQETFRTHFTWLPDHADIVVTVRETQHGLKVLYANGHLLEYAVFDMAEIAVARVNDYRVVFDRADVAAALDAVRAAPTTTTSPANLQREMGMFLCLLVVGAGRVARGEVISGQVFIRTYALTNLLALLGQVREGPDKAKLDNLDPLRRFEAVFPTLGAQVNVALALPPISAARTLLDIYERELSAVAGYSQTAVDTVRAVLLRAAADGS